MTAHVIRASALVDRACLFLAKLALAAMVVAVLFQIWARYGLDHPFSWTEELARYLMIWAGLLGATCAFKRRLDPVVVTVPDDAPALRRHLSLVFLVATVVIFLAPVLYYVFFGPGMNIERGFLWRSSNRISPGLNLNMAVVGSVIPVTCVVIFLHLAARIAETGRRT
ncbi:TRAP transporter small permease [Aquicoccus porphyridii]|uniref:TRAP transporter small permease n=1 Tax=Aquicoccus porphyridii TaxID=1852029 RepID=UPI00273F86A5|nr:TRAP transporter small permease [Aquicoccus porphyridii]